EERGSVGIIITLAGIVKDMRQEFSERDDLKPNTKLAWKNAPDDELVVTIKYNRGIKHYCYPLSALFLYLDDSNCQSLGIDYTKIYEAQKIHCAKRQPLMKEFLDTAQKFLASYQINLNRDNVNEHYQKLFLAYPNKPFSQTQLLFGNNGITKASNYILDGLKEGKVYQRIIPDDKVIQIGILQLCNGDVSIFIKQLKERLQTYGFLSEISNHITETLSGSPFQQRAVADQKAVDLAYETDLVIIFLPTYDRSHDEIEGGSLYHRLTQRLLRMQKPKQVIYQDTLKQNPKYVLNQVVPGIIAKLGNTPYILAKPLKIADFFIGLDVSRKPKKNLPGSMNACASVCVYGNQGQFIGYQVEPGVIEGEVIPANLLENCLSNPELRGKRVLIYRDGLFRGDEIEHLVNWSSTQKSKLILVECRKSGNPRLYRWNSQSKRISPPPQALGMLLPRNQLILVTTEVSEKIGLAKPLRLTVRPEGESANMTSLMHATLCLTLLHYGSLRKPRLPIPLYGADLLSYLNLQGVLTHNLYGNYQFW
ncbi:stem cell self-renewal protein Piwi, partial [Planktothrix sp. FACHB-1355]